MMSDLHFIEPLWFLALIPLGLLLWWAWRGDAGGSAWRQIVDARLLAVLQVGRAEPARQWPLLLLAAGWLLAVLALANPTLEREPVPAFRTDAARVVVLDLSRSMLADDLTPSRLERARYKVADILSRSVDGQVGLVAFAGDAFAVSPLTDDADTIRAMLEALSPQIMPLQGSRPDRGIDLGLDLLRQAGARDAEVILITDDAGGVRARTAAERLRKAGHRLGVIGVGTAEGASVPGVTSADGPVIARLDEAALEQLAAAGAGRYATLSSSDRDLDQVLIDPSLRPRALAERDPMLAERWRELGPWITLLLVPLAALVFRRGWLAMLVFALAPGALMLPQPALAFGWADLWQRQEQQAAEALAAGQLERARELAQSPSRAGSAAYRLGDYDDAAARFAAGDSARDHYNRANALARDGELEAALAAYDEALKREPGLEDARYNRAQVEAALRAQAQQPPQQSSQQSSSDEQSPSQEPVSGSQGGDQQQSPGDAAADQDQGEQDARSSSTEQDQSGPGSASQSQADQTNGADPSADAEAAGAEDSDGEAAQGSAPDEREASGAQAAASEPATQDQAQDQAQNQAQDQTGHQAGDPEGPPADAAAQAELDEQAAADYRDEAAQAGGGEGAEQGDAEADATIDAATNLGPSGPATDRQAAALDPQEREARQAADHWLRRIPDDPAELLRRKFLYQYQTRQNRADDLSSGTPW